VFHPAGLGSNRLPLSHKIKDVPVLEEQLVNNARRFFVVHVIDRAGWLHAWHWEALNSRRERLAAKARARLVFWLNAEAIALAYRHAPDLWAWRGGNIISFLPASAPASPPGVEPDTAPSSPLRTAESAINSLIAEQNHLIKEIPLHSSRRDSPAEAIKVGQRKAASQASRQTERAPLRIEGRPPPEAHMIGTLPPYPAKTACNPAP
jgi:hypothetical protein